LQSKNPFFQFSRFEAVHFPGSRIFELALPAPEDVLHKYQLGKPRHPALDEQALDVGIPEFAQDLQLAFQNAPCFLGRPAGCNAADDQELRDQPPRRNPKLVHFLL